MLYPIELQARQNERQYIQTREAAQGGLEQLLEGMPHPAQHHDGLAAVAVGLVAGTEDGNVHCYTPEALYAPGNIMASAKTS